MVEAGAFLTDLGALGITRFFGVPDSLLSGLIAEMERLGVNESTADEGAAVGLAIGHYLATGAPACVFMQNSGLGNAVNPLTSLASPKVYGIPMLLLIGWRGEMTAEGQLKDEPQHVFQGEITCEMLDLLGLPYRVIGPSEDRAAIRAAAADLLKIAKDQSKPTALVIRKGTFSGAPKAAAPASNFPEREAAIAEALRALPGVPSVGTTGKISREIYELQEAEAIGGPAFLTVGGMGHAAMIAAGAALADPGRKVACFDGDGAILMHTGSLATSARCPNLIHLVFNNRCHDSVGGQETAMPDAPLAEIAEKFGYHALRLSSLAEIAPACAAALARDQASLIEIMVAPGARADLGRPKASPAESKDAFMKGLQHDT